MRKFFHGDQFWLLGLAIVFLGGIPYAIVTYPVSVEFLSSLPDVLVDSQYLGISFSVLFFFLVLTVYLRSTIVTQASTEAAVLTSSLSESNQLFLELFQNSPVPYLHIKRDGVVIRANVAANRLFGVKENQLEGRNVFQLFESDDETHLSLLMPKLQNGNFINDEELRLTRADELTRWVRLSAFPSSRRTEGMLTLVDITKQKEVDIAKSEFVSLASHQLRTPISALNWNIELLGGKTAGTLTEKQTGYLTKIERNVKKMKIIIEDFLNMSQLEMGTFATKSVTMALTPFLQDIADSFEESKTAKNITSNMQFATPDLTLNTDEHLMHNIVSNLYSNAVKYTPEGGVVEIGFRYDAQNVQIWVRDSGMGIPKEEQERLFTKFFRATNAKESVAEGSGLGLYIVKTAVEYLNGTIELNSETGAGSVFLITLPRT